jgi:hypothetical protein
MISQSQLRPESPELCFLLFRSPNISRNTDRRKSSLRSEEPIHLLREWHQTQISYDDQLFVNIGGILILSIEYWFELVFFEVVLPVFTVNFLSKNSTLVSASLLHAGVEPGWKLTNGFMVRDVIRWDTLMDSSRTDARKMT